MKRETKVCPKCKAELNLTTEFFHRDRTRKDGFRFQCKVCVNAHNKRYVKNNPEKNSKIRKKNYLKNPKQWVQQRLRKNYKITLEDYDRMFEAQGGVCAICGGINKNGRRLGVDHNHETGKVRGLLCTQCNLALGGFRDSVSYLIQAIAYLREME